MSNLESAIARNRAYRQAIGILATARQQVLASIPANGEQWAEKMDAYILINRAQKHVAEAFAARR